MGKQFVQFMYSEVFGSTTANWNTGSTSENNETLNVMNENKGMIPYQKPESIDKSFACFQNDAYVDGEAGNAEPRLKDAIFCQQNKPKRPLRVCATSDNILDPRDHQASNGKTKNKEAYRSLGSEYQAGTSTHATSYSKQETFRSATLKTNMDIHSPTEVDRSYSYLEGVESELFVQTSPTTQFGHASGPTVKTDAVSSRGNIYRSPQAIDPVSRLRRQKKGKTPLRKDIRIEDIERYRGNFSLVEAAKCLGVSRSTLKRCCRDLKIPHWDRYRDECFPTKKGIHASGGSAEPEEAVPKRPKAAIQEFPQNSHRDVHDGSPTWQLVNSMVVKVRHRDDTFKFKICSSSNMHILAGEVGKRINLEVGKFVIKYKDDEGDWISLTCNDDWQCCMNNLGSLEKIEMMVEPRKA